MGFSLLPQEEAVARFQPGPNKSFATGGMEALAAEGPGAAIRN